jgi:hypothetical protein
MGPGSHVGFPISAKNKKLVYDHPMNISAKFDSNLFCGFRKQDENPIGSNVKLSRVMVAILNFRSANVSQV